MEQQTKYCQKSKLFKDLNEFSKIKHKENLHIIHIVILVKSKMAENIFNRIKISIQIIIESF